MRNFKHLLRISASIGGVALCCRWQNHSLVTTRYNISFMKLPKSFDGYRIVQISDLHNTKFGPNQAALLEKIREERPDRIVITGDLIDRRRPDVETAMQFIRGAVQIAPVSYVPGNHEIRSGIYSHIVKKLNEAGVEVLNDKAVEIIREKDTIRLIGMSDFTYDYSRYSKQPRLFGAILKSLTQKQSEFQILLSHRPELVPLYSKCGIDLAFCGHAHGGQIRIPFVGAIYAPEQTLFPEYTCGVYSIGHTRMIVSRGLGNSLFPLRIFNRPEIVSVILERVNK